jgi:hypothetical protein
MENRSRGWRRRGWRGWRTPGWRRGRRSTSGRWRKIRGQRLLLKQEGSGRRKKVERGIGGGRRGRGRPLPFPLLNMQEDGLWRGGLQHPGQGGGGNWAQGVGLEQRLLLAFGRGESLVGRLEPGHVRIEKSAKSSGRLGGWFFFVNLLLRLLLGVPAVNLLLHDVILRIRPVNEVIEPLP